MSQLIVISPGGLLAVAWTGAAVATALTVVRLWIRITRLRRLFWDDAFHMLALSILISCAAAYIPMVPILFRLSRISNGTENVTVHFLVEEVPIFFQYQFVMITLFWTTVWAVKISFLIFYRRFFEGLKNHMIAWWAVLVFTLLAYVGCWVSFLTACGTPHDYFHSSLVACALHESTNRAAISVRYSTAVDILSDIMIMALPLRILTALRISIRQKLALAGIFCLGAIIITFSIVRAIETSSSLTNSWSLEQSDPVWLALWSVSEASVAVCVSSLPTMRLFFTKTKASTPGITPPGGSNTIGSTPSNPLRRIPTPLSPRPHSHARLPSLNSPVHIHPTTNSPRPHNETKERPLSDSNPTVTSGWTSFTEEKTQALGAAEVNRQQQIQQQLQSKYNTNNIHRHPTISSISSPISPISRYNSLAPRDKGAASPPPPGFSPIKGPNGGLEHTALRELEVPPNTGTTTMGGGPSFVWYDETPPSEGNEHEGRVFEMGSNTPHRGGSIV